MKLTQPFSVKQCPGSRNWNKCTKRSRPSLDIFSCSFQRLVREIIQAKSDSFLLSISKPCRHGQFSEAKVTFINFPYLWKSSETKSFNFPIAAHSWKI